MKKKKKLKHNLIEGQTVSELIERLKQLPQDAVVVRQDGAGDYPVVDVHVGFAYHAFPDCDYISQYLFVRKEHVDDPLQEDREYYAKPPFSTTKRLAVEFE